MAASISDNKKSRGRPKSTGTGTLVGARWQPATLTAIDEWRRGQPDIPSRTEAIRRLVEIALAAESGTRKGR
jgi:hypothetical protein